MKKRATFFFRFCQHHPLRLAMVAALVSYWGYQWLFDAQLAFGIICLLLLHELGHFVVARLSGVRIGVPLLIPFLGAVINMGDDLAAPPKIARIALGGPLLGTVGAVSFAILYWWLADVNWLILAYVGALLNLFNLIPAEPLDGGQAARFISPALWWLGICIIGTLAIVTMSLFIWLIFLFSLLRCGSMPLDEEACLPDAAAGSGEKCWLLLLYLWLIFVLGGLLLWLTELLRQFS